MRTIPDTQPKPGLFRLNGAGGRERRGRAREDRLADDSELCARSAIDGIPGLVAILGPGGAIELLNRQIIDYCGGGLEVLQSWDSNEVIHPDDLPHTIEVFESSIAAGTPFQIEQRVRRRDGVYRWFANRGAPIHDSRGRVVRWCILLTDIDDRKRAENLLAGEKQLLEMIASSSPLRSVLAALCEVVELAAPDCYCDIHPIDWTGPTIEYSIAPSLPESYTGPIAGAPLRADLVPCGISATEKVQVISENFDTDPRWCASPVRAHVRDHGLCSVWSTPICTREGSVLGTLCIYQRQPAVPQPHHQDIIARATHIASIAIERLRAEDELRRSEASLADGQRISLTGSFSWNVDTDGMALSEQLRQILEFGERAPVTFDRVLERVHPEDAEAFAEKMGRLQRGEDSPEFEVRLRMPDGRIKHAMVFGRVVCHGAGRFECIGAVQDVTRRRLAEEALDTVRSELAHVSRVMSLGTLAASIAHEVNQPLSGIVTNANTCLRMLDAEPPNIEGAIETARRTIRDGTRASEVVNRLRALFRRKDCAAEVVDLNQAAREVAALSAQDLQRQGIAFAVAFDEGLPEVFGDRVQLQQVILNLLLNAADALKDVERRDRRIVLSTTLRDDWVELSVRDNGVGIDPEQIGKVFDAFHTTKHDGMGIGLSVSRSIIESHQGRIWASANADAGATFAFALQRQLF